MKLYGGIDLHSNNLVLALLDEQDRVVYQQRLANELSRVLGELEPFQEAVKGLVVESTYNWYWLVDGLQAAGYRVHLANTAAIEQYAGLKHTDDHSDARWLAHLLRLGILPEGHIYPPQRRAVRDLLRKRSQLVRQRTTNLLSIQNLLARHTGSTLSANRIKRLSVEELSERLPVAAVARAAASNLAVLRCLEEQIAALEAEVLAVTREEPPYRGLLTVSGIGRILALTIALETGDIQRFARVGQFASYCRCVDSQKLTNGKKKGEGNVKSGNRYLAWAFVEAANFAVRYEPRVKAFHQRKRARSNAIVAIKAVAHKLARACYYVMRDRVPFQVERAFA
ncbi:MAG: IS110 family transposase [Gammaproteobacteria bacterium]|jgi:transposase|nr:IS110 family transposase [Gammaproteobacteria bacterium]